MIEITGKYTSAKVFTENLEESALTQIKGFCDQPFFASSKINLREKKNSTKFGNYYNRRF